MYNCENYKRWCNFICAIGVYNISVVQISANQIHIDPLLTMYEITNLRCAPCVINYFHLYFYPLTWYFFITERYKILSLFQEKQFQLAALSEYIFYCLFTIMQRLLLLCLQTNDPTVRISSVQCTQFYCDYVMDITVYNICNWITNY